MPIATIEEGRNEILLHFTTAWNAGPTPPLLLYDDKPRDLPQDAAFARVMVQHNVFSQRTLGGKVALGGGGSRFGRNGLVTVQIFTPMGDGLTSADPLVDLALDAFEGESTGSDRVEFRNARSIEAGNDGIWYQTNVVADFEYDRVK
jgi:hypothetical protein